MFAGTSTGSILSTALSVATFDEQKQYIEPIFWADHVLDVYIDGRETIFKKNVGQSFYIFLCYAFYFVFFATIFFIIGRYKYNNPTKYEAFISMQKLLDENKLHLLEVREKNENLEKAKCLRIIDAVEEVK